MTWLDELAADTAALTDAGVGSRQTATRRTSSRRPATCMPEASQEAAAAGYAKRSMTAMQSFCRMGDSP